MAQEKIKLSLLSKRYNLFPFEADVDPIVIHFIGAVKPWNSSDMAHGHYWHREKEILVKRIKEKVDDFLATLF